jgi:hypothetical protein
VLAASSFLMDSDFAIYIYIYVRYGQILIEVVKSNVAQVLRGIYYAIAPLPAVIRS